DKNGNIVQQTHYYPFGLAMSGSTGQGAQPYKFTGKELDLENGLNLYDFDARTYDPSVGRFTSVDPLAEKYYSISPYAYCLNNPVRLIDLDGKDPGDFFKTVIAAAKDWGMYYNGASILRGKEFGSSIFVVNKDGKTYYSYSVAYEGTAGKTKVSKSPNGEKIIADIHSHGEYISDTDNDFSNKDKRGNYNDKIDGYLTTPNGSLKKYDVETAKTTTISTNLPSDPKDPDRKNEVNPTDVPLEKQRAATTKEQEEKPELKVPPFKLEDYKWFF
ncbi:MAG: DUF4329 domain-containing protein, partial [Dysgonamonadaceae bacterium]|nr:DUF4329 domain-containing protein [Dysgonamonadaceae bacterium]